MTERLDIPPLLVEVGSTAHGTGIPGGEDHDELGVVVESPVQLMGLDEHGFKTVMQRTQPEGARSGPVTPTGPCTRFAVSFGSLDRETHRF